MTEGNGKLKENGKSKVRLETAAIIISLIAVGISYYIGEEALSVNQRTLETTKKFESLRMIRELTTQFNTEQIFLDVRADIESCKPLYKSWGGSHSHNTLNIYLNFFESLAFFNRENMIDMEITDYFFGAYLVEASAHPHIIKYIHEFQRNGQPNAFIDFEQLSQKLINDSSTRRDLASSYKNACSVVDK